MENRSLLIPQEERDIRTFKMPPGLSPRIELSKIRNFKSRFAPSKISTPKVFQTVKLLPEDSYGIKQVDSRQFEAVRKQTSKRIPGAKNSKNLTSGIMQVPRQRDSRSQNKGKSSGYKSSPEQQICLPEGGMNMFNLPEV